MGYFLVGPPNIFYAYVYRNFQFKSLDSSTCDTAKRITLYYNPLADLYSTLLQSQSRI